MSVPVNCQSIESNWNGDGMESDRQMDGHGMRTGLIMHMMDGWRSGWTDR